MSRIYVIAQRHGQQGPDGQREAGRGGAEVGEGRGGDIGAVCNGVKNKF